jgi:hypothetical protein
VLLDRSLERLRRESASAQFDRLKVFLTGDLPGVSYNQLAAELGDE